MGPIEVSSLHYAFIINYLIICKRVYQSILVNLRVTVHEKGGKKNTYFDLLRVMLLIKLDCLGVIQRDCS